MITFFIPSFPVLPLCRVSSFTAGAFRRDPSSPAYAVALRNINDSASQTSLINVEITKLEENLWLVTYIKVLMKDGVTYEYVLAELETHAR